MPPTRWRPWWPTSSLARGDDDRVVVSSFHLPAIDRLRVVAPAIETAYLVKVITNLGRADGACWSSGATGVSIRGTAS